MKIGSSVYAIVASILVFLGMFLSNSFNNMPPVTRSTLLIDSLVLGLVFALAAHNALRAIITAIKEKKE